MKEDVILGKDLFNYKGIKICTDSNGTRIYIESTNYVKSKMIQSITVSPEFSTRTACITKLTKKTGVAFVPPEGYKNVLLIDAFTKYLFLIPLKTLSGPET